MADFRLLHISDLHMSLLPNRHNIKTNSLHNLEVLRALFKRQGNLFYPATFDRDIAESVARFAYDRRDAFDTILITGDIATTGLDEDLEPAFKYVDDRADGIWLAKDGFPTLQGANSRITLLPGNHDRYDSNWAKPGGINFDTIFSKYWSGSTPVRSTVITKSDGTSLGIISVDFALASNSFARWRPRAKYGQGRACRKTIKLLVRETKKAKAEHNDIAIIWAMHFPPKYDASPRHLKLRNGHKVIRAAKRHDIPLILAGHHHKKLEYEVRGTRVICAGTSTSLDQGNGNTLHEITFSLANGGSLNWECKDYAWNQNKGTFVRV